MNDVLAGQVNHSVHQLYHIAHRGPDGELLNQYVNAR